MACQYIYKGKVFNSELELDDYLLLIDDLVSKFGDTVFSVTNPNNTSRKNLTESILSKEIPESKKMRDKYRLWRKTVKNHTDDGEPLIDLPPYIGVNKFLNGLKIDGTLLFPEFQEDNYWNNRFSKWKNGDFTNNKGELDMNEILEFGLDPDNLPSTIDSSRFEDMKESMKKRWALQAKAGDAIHNVLLLFFTKVDGHYLFEKTDAELESYLYDKLDSDNKPYITPEVVKSTLAYARQLHKDLINEFGDNLSFYPEFTIVLDTTSPDKTTLLGMIDLLIIDGNGKAHILDYKTSTHDYLNFGGAKLLSYNYLLAVYQRILESKGIDITEGKLLISPIQLVNFRHEGDTYLYDDINYVNTFERIGESSLSLKIGLNIDTFLSIPIKLHTTLSLAQSVISDVMSHWAPAYETNKVYTKEYVIEFLKRREMLTPDKNGNYVFLRGKDSPIISTDKVEFIDKVLNYLLNLEPTRKRLTSQVKSQLRRAMKDGIRSVDFVLPFLRNKGESVTWISDTLKPYCNGNWEIQDNPLAEEYGLIMLKTVDGFEPKQVDFIRISTNDLYEHYYNSIDKDERLKYGRGLTGLFETDLQANSKPNSLMLEGVRGNVELMETMLIINQIDGLLNYTVGNIQVVSPYYGNGLAASNEELFYCFKLLNRFYKVPNNQFEQGIIKLARKYELVALKFAHIMHSGEENEWNDEYKFFKAFKSAIPMMDQVINGNKEDKIKALLKLLEMLEGRNMGEGRSNMLMSLDAIYDKLSDLKLKHIDLYNSILMAISSLKGVNFRLQLKDHDQWLESIMIHKQGLSGTYLDNPGNLDSETLNLVTKLVTEAYQNTRDDILRVKPKIKKLVEAIKNEASFNYLEETTVGNQTSLYSDLFEEKDGDLLFVHPDTVGSAAKAEFLRYALRIINKNRFGWDEERCALEEAAHNILYFQVPLCMGNSDTIASEQGLMSLLRAKLSYLNPKTAYEMARKKMEGIFSDEEDYDYERGKKSLILYKMSNIFDLGQSQEKRLLKIAEFKKNKIPFEKNLESLLFKHIFAYSVQNNMDSVFPMIKAAMVHLQIQGALKNEQFSQDTKYFEEYIRNKIFNKSIVNENNQGWVKKVNMLKKAASMFTLALSPVQAIYQSLQGLWTDIRLMIQKPDGTKAFTFSHFTNALKLVYSNLTHFSDKPTICSALNELYGINDMDMNSYIEKISYTRKGIWNMNNFLMKFSQRPDFYNRMTIFTCLMMGDGCLEAHSINEDGELVYDWTKDKRFEAFANNRTSDPKYNEQRSLYYAVAQLFVNEHAKNADGTDFELNMSKPMALPRAYTNKQAESMKSLADDIYGYYSHEKKSLIMSTCLGSLWLQFRTYWSGKKNQYLGSSGVKLKGSWKLKEENGLKYYYLIDIKTGDVLYDEPPISEEEANRLGIPLVAPVMQWQGQWQEGIFITVMDLLRTMWQTKSIKGGWDKKLGTDATLRLVYESNLKLLSYDLTMWLIVGSIIGALLGDWLDELKKDNKKNRDFVSGLGVAAANVAVLSVKNSFLDFNFIESIGMPFGQWTPFSFEWAIRQGKTWWNTAMGDEDFWDAVVRTSGGLKQIKPALDTLKPDMFRTEQEGGTFKSDK